MQRIRQLELALLVLLAGVYLVFVGPALFSAKSWMLVAAAVFFGLALIGWGVSFVLTVIEEHCK